MSERMTVEEWFTRFNDGRRTSATPQETKEILWDWQNDRVELRGLLRRCKSVIDVCGVDWKHVTSRLDPVLFDELEEELGDD